MLKIFISACLFATALGANIPLGNFNSPADESDVPLDEANIFDESNISPEESNIQEHIVGGKNTDISQVPYQVALYYNGNFRCGGIIVSPTVIVTAAHCLVGVQATGLSFRAGSTNVYQGGVVVKAKTARVHSYYNQNTQDYDVGVVELASPLQFSNNIKAIRLATSEPPPNANVLVSGWGLLRENGQMSPTLQSVSVPVVSTATCSNWYAGYAKITPRMICAGVEGKDSCAGDSGGPLAYNGQLIGVVSFGRGCARRNYPGVYANVANPDINAFIRKYANI